MIASQFKYPSRVSTYPRGSTLRCDRCSRTGTPGQITGHQGRGPCHGGGITVLSYPPGSTMIAQPVSPAAAPVAREVPSASAEEAAVVAAIEAMAVESGAGGEEWDDQDEAEERSDDDVDEDPDQEAEDDDRTASVPIAVTTPPPRGRPPHVERPPAFVDDAWRPAHLSPETHVYYRLACTDPDFEERFGGLYRGPIGAFVDDIVHAFFTRHLGYTLGLAAIVEPPPERETVTLSIEDLRQVVTGIVQGASNGRESANAGAA